MQHNNPWQHLSTKVVYKDEWISVYRDDVIRPDDQPGSYTYIETRDSVMIVALDDKQEIYLEWTYRYPTKSWGWELPGGGIDNLSELETAKAELREECNYTADTWEVLGKNSLYNGLVTGSIHYFSAVGLHSNNDENADDSELTNTGRFFSIKAINEMIVNAEITDSQSVAALHMFGLKNTQTTSVT